MKQLVADLREVVTEQIHYHELLMEMTKRDLLLRYKQTVMGFGWAIFTPLVNTVVFSIIFTRVAPIETPVPYPVYSYCGLLAWNFSASTLRASVGSLTSNGGLVSKVYFPREIFPISAMLVALVDFGVGSSLLVLLMLWFHVTPPVYVLLLPFVLLIQIMLTSAIALLIAMGNLFFRDVKYIFEVVLTVWMFATPVLYPVDSVGGYLGALLKLNPMAPVVNGYRDVILGASPPDFLALGIVGCFSAVALVTTWVIFHRSEFEFAERL